MIHYLKLPNGSSLEIEMGCNHPDMKGNNAASVGCDGDCASCPKSIASMTIPEMLALLEQAGFNRGRRKTMSRMEEIKKIQAELDRRTEIENRAIELMKQMRYEEAGEVLAEIGEVEE